MVFQREVALAQSSALFCSAADHSSSPVNNATPGGPDEPCLDADLMLKRTIPSSALAALPRTGHACNLEEPALFNRLVQDFVTTVDEGRWTSRDPRSVSEHLTVR